MGGIQMTESSWQKDDKRRRLDWTRCTVCDRLREKAALRNKACRRNSPQDAHDRTSSTETEGGEEKEEKGSGLGERGPPVASRVTDWPAGV